MIDNLREEIKELMVKANSWEEIEGQDSEYFTNEILKIFEKRINSIYIKHPNTAGIGHNECLDQIKREILKS